MTEPLAAIHLPPNSQYVRITVSEKTVGYLNPTSYDRVLYDDAAFEAKMAKPGAREEDHSAEPGGRRVVRLRGEDALRAMHEDLSKRDTAVSPETANGTT